MSSRRRWWWATIVLVFLVPCVPALSKPLFAPSRHTMVTGDPEEPDYLSFAEEFPCSYAPNLIDLPSTDLVEDHHPTLEMTYVHRGLGKAAFTNVVQARQQGVRLSAHFRLSRDFQLTLEAPFYKERLTLAGAWTPDIPGTVSAGTAEIKYLIPWEIAGLRTALGARASTLKERSHPLFTPDDFARLYGLFIVTTLTPTPATRLSSTALYANMGQPEPLTHNSLWLFGVAAEQQLFRLKANYVRWIGEVVMHRYAHQDYNYYGTLPRKTDLFYNSGLRIRTGIIQIDLGLRHLGHGGYNEQYATLVKRF
ncbi:MAG: hypothetical protein HY815_13585 [Candidatus Riflebacteria bacterium]|nr:hypothetical protein [Candidatus Riflebacteria bacterium]